VRVIRLQTLGRHRFIAYEGVAGNSLLEIMRKRRRLTLPEVLILLGQAASAADHGVEHDIAGLAFNLSMVRILTAEAAVGGKNEAWMTQPCHQWPSFTLKIPFYGSLPGLDLDPSFPGAASSREERLISYLRALGETAHELLGGVKPRNIPFSEASYTPLSTLSEQGNILLRRALFGVEKPAFASASEFVTALKGTVTDKDFPSSNLGGAKMHGESITLPQPAEQTALGLLHGKKGLAAVLLLLIIGIIAVLLVVGARGNRITAPPQDASLPKESQPGQQPPVVPQPQTTETPPQAHPVASEVPVAPVVQTSPPSPPPAEVAQVPAASASTSDSSNQPSTNQSATNQASAPQGQTAETPQPKPQVSTTPTPEAGEPVPGDKRPKEKPVKDGAAKSAKKPAPKPPISGPDAPKP